MSSTHIQTLNLFFFNWNLTTMTHNNLDENALDRLVIYSGIN